METLKPQINRLYSILVHLDCDLDSHPLAYLSDFEFWESLPQKEFERCMAQISEELRALSDYLVANEDYVHAAYVWYLTQQLEQVHAVN